MRLAMNALPSKSATVPSRKKETHSFGRFMTVRANSGIYKKTAITIKSKTSIPGLFLDVDDGKAQNGRNVWQWTKNKTNAQKWILEDAGNGYVYIKTALGDYYLDAQNAKSD